MNKAVIYHRCNGQPELTKKYTEICSDMSYVLDYEVVGIFTDENDSSLGLEQAFQAIKSGEAEILVSFNKTTLSRNSTEFNQFHELVLQWEGRLQLFNPTTFPEEV